MTGYQAESFTLRYYVLERVHGHVADSFRIMEVLKVVGVFGVILRTERCQVAWHRNFYTAQDAVKVLNKKTGRVTWNRESCSAAKGLDL